MALSKWVVEAKLALGAIHPEDFPAMAIELLEAGIDGPVTRRIAGLIRPTGYEVDQLKPAFMAEAGLAEIDPRAAAARLAQDLAREVLRNGKDPLRFTRAFERLWIGADYADRVQGLGTMGDEVYLYGANEDAARGRAWSR
jgi:hypothetical protein